MLWRDVMGSTGVAAPRYINLLGEEYEDKLRETHHAVYTSGSGTAYLAVARYYPE